MKLPKLLSYLCLMITVLGFSTTKGYGFETSSVKFKNAPLNAADSVKLIELRGILSKPDGNGPFPAVVLLHTCGGPNETTTKFWPEYLASLGYVTLAVDSMGPRGIRPGKCQPLLKNKKSVSRDAYGALGYLTDLPFVDEQQIAVMGYSLGGILINYFVRQSFASPKGLNFKVGVSLYGHCSSKQLGSPPYAASPQIPLILIIGDQEQEKFFNSCRNAANLPNTESYILKGAYHAFDNPDYTSIKYDFARNPMLYSKKGTERAKTIIKAALGKYLVGEKTQNPSASDGTRQPLETKTSIELIGPTGRTATQTISFMDGDGDGKIAKSEWRGPTHVFPLIDANSDGFLTKQEFNKKWR